MPTTTTKHSLRLLCAAGSLAAAHASTHADSVYEMRWNADGTRGYTLASADVQSPQQGFRAYDNFRNVTTLRGRYHMGGDEFADDLQMTTTGASLLTDLGYSISNTSSTHTLQRVGVTLRLYGENRDLLFTDFDVLNIPIPANSGISLSTTSNFYLRFGIYTTPHMFLSIQFSDAMGVDTADVGCTLASPRTIGYSTQYAYNFTTGAAIDFNGSDQTNMMFFVDTAEAPSPTVISLLAAAASVHAARRRRCSP